MNAVMHCRPEPILANVTDSNALMDNDVNENCLPRNVNVIILFVLWQIQTGINSILLLLRNSLSHCSSRTDLPVHFRRLCCVGGSEYTSMAGTRQYHRVHLAGRHVEHGPSRIYHPRAIV